MGHRTAEDYGKFALEGAKLMRWTDPNIKLIAAGSSNFNADWIGWNRTVLEYLKEHTDFISLHSYVGNKENDYYEFQAATLDVARRIKIVSGLIDEVLSGAPSHRKIYQAWDEWNVWYRARGDAERGRRILEERYNLEDALVVSSFLNTFVNHADTVKIANMAQLVNVIAPIFTNEKGSFLQPIYYPLQLFATHSHGTALDILIESPTYQSKKGLAVPYLDGSAVKTSDGMLVINVTNRHLDKPIAASLELKNNKFDGEFEVHEVNGPDIKAENNFNKTSVKTTRQKSVTGRETSLQYSFPPHSFTMLKGRIS
jgi:alpha-L-arabinofuranosidase